MLFKIAGFLFGWGITFIAASAVIFVVATLKFVVTELSK